MPPLLQSAGVKLVDAEHGGRERIVARTGEKGQSGNRKGDTLAVPFGELPHPLSHHHGLGTP